jgi:AP-3 complex subunit sigma
MHTIVDEIIFGGQVLETSSTEVMKAIEEISKCLSLSLSLSCVVCAGG